MEEPYNCELLPPIIWVLETHLLGTLLRTNNFKAVIWAPGLTDWLISYLSLRHSLIPSFSCAYAHTTGHPNSTKIPANPRLSLKDFSENITLREFTLILHYFLNMVSNSVADRINLAGYLKRPCFIYSYLLILNRMSFHERFSLHLWNIQDNSDSPRKVKFHILYFCIRGK